MAGACGRRGGSFARTRAQRSPPPGTIFQAHGGTPTSPAGRIPMKAVFLTPLFFLPVAWLLTQERWDRRWIEAGPATRSFVALWPHRPAERIVSLMHRRFGRRAFVGHFAQAQGLHFCILYADVQASRHASTAE